MDTSSYLPLIGVLIFLYFIFKNKNYSNFKQAPEPSGAWPIIGHLHLLGGAEQLLYRTLGTMADKYGQHLIEGSALAKPLWLVVKKWQKNALL